MNAITTRPVRRMIITAFTIWFVHFVACWAAVEIWPEGPMANRLAWAFTALALLAMGVHFVRLGRGGPGAALHAEVTGFSRRFARGAIAIATVAVLFTALPSIVFAG